MNNQKSAKKKQLRFNVIDLIIVLLLVACIAGIAMRMNIGEKIGVSAKLQEAEISFLVLDVRYTSAEAFYSDDSVYVQDTGKYIGKLMSDYTSVSPAEYFSHAVDGSVKLCYYPENTRIDVRGKIKTEGLMTDDGFLYGGNTYIAPGSSLTIETGKIDVSILVVDIALK